MNIPKINIIDIGSNGGLIKNFNKYVKNIGRIITADPLASSSDVNNKVNNVIKCCIFDREGIKPFYIYRKSACSSLFPVDYQQISKYRNRKDIHDFDCTSVINVPCIRLDTVLADYDNTKFNYIKIDTQGADLNVVRSLGKYIENIIAIHIELYFVQFYQSISLFNEAESYLKSKGFLLFSGLRKPNPVFGDFLFLRDSAKDTPEYDMILKIYGTPK